MKFRVTVGNVWWVETDTLARAQGTAVGEQGALDACLGHGQLSGTFRQIQFRTATTIQ